MKVDIAGKLGELKKLAEDLDKKSEEAFSRGSAEEAQAWSVASSYVENAVAVLESIEVGDFSILDLDPSLEVDRSVAPSEDKNDNIWGRKG